MDDFADDFRLRYLAISGGWLGRLVIGISKPTGAWDHMVLSFVIVIWYQVVRASKMEMAAVLGIYLDGVIPYQYWHGEQCYALHKDHLDDYWPMFLLGSLGEIGAYLVLDPPPFTFLVCVKSMVLCFIWMGQTKEGVFLSSLIRRGKLAQPSVIPLGGVDWVMQLSGDPPNVNLDNDTQQLPPVVDIRYPTADKDLTSKYLDPYARYGMVNQLKSMPDNESKSALARWLSDPADPEKGVKYAKKARQTIAGITLQNDVARRALAHPASPNPSNPLTVTNPAATPSIGMNLASVDDLLKVYFPDPIVRQGMLETYRADKRPANAEKNLKKWISEEDEIPRRTREYRLKGQIARQWRNELDNNRVPVFVDPHCQGWNERLKPLYHDPWVRYAIITRLLTHSSKLRESKLKALEDETSVSQRTKIYGEQADAIQDLFDDDGWEMKQVAGTPGRGQWKTVKPVIGASRGGEGIGAERQAWLKAKMRAANMGPSEAAKILEVFNRTRCVSQESAALERLKFHNITFELGEGEKAAQTRLFRSTLDPVLTTLLSDRLDDPDPEKDFDDQNPEIDLDTRMDRQLTAELLRAPTHTTEDMAKIADAFEEFGLTPFPAPPMSKLDPKTLTDLRLKLLKLYEEISLVDVMMAHVARSPTIELANQQANLMIEAGNTDQQDTVRERFYPNAHKLEKIKEGLCEHYKTNVMEVMKVEIMSKPPAEWDGEYARFCKIGKGKKGNETERALYEQTAEAYEARALNDRYYKPWRKNDMRKSGLFNKMLSKVGKDRLYFG